MPADTDGNLFFSSYSLSLALAMAYAGAPGETAQQMANTMHLVLPPERLHPARNRLDRELSSRGKDEDSGTSKTWQAKAPPSAQAAALRRRRHCLARRSGDSVDGRRISVYAVPYRRR